MSKKVTQTVAIGAGLFKSGDPVKAPPASSAKLKNVFVRPGPRYEKRAGWANDAITTVGAYTTMGLAKYVDSTSTDQIILFGGGVSDDSFYRTSGAVWTTMGASSDSRTDPVDYTNFKNKLWVVASQSDQATPTYPLSTFYFSWDGTTATGSTAWGTANSSFGLGGRSICTFVRRLFVGNTDVQPFEFLQDPDNNYGVNGGVTLWTVGGAGLTLTHAGNPPTIATTAAATGTCSLTYGAALGADTWVSWIFSARSQDAVNDAPFTLSILNNAATVTYATRSILVYNRTTNADWQTFWCQAYVPSGVTPMFRITAGNPSKAATASTIDVAFYDAAVSGGTSRGTQIVGGRFMPDYGDGGGFGGGLLGGRKFNYPSRIYWCETDDTTYWRATNYFDCKEVAGPITAVRNVGGRFCAFKSNAVWAFQPSADPDLPIQLEKLHTGFGCKNPRSIKTLEGLAYFISDQEVYAWDGASEPQPLAGEAMRETLFPSNLPDYETFLEIDTDKKEVWVYTQAAALYVYNIENKSWAGPITVTGASDSALNVRALLYIKPSGETSREMWALLKDSTAIGKLRSTQTQDTVSGTQNVTSEVWLHPLETQRPRHPITLESAAIDHQISVQGGSDQLTFEVSRDGGQSFTKTNQVVISDLSAGAGDTKRLTVPLWQTAPRLLVGIKHVGLAGASYFNMTGGDLKLQIRGEEVPATKPTQGSASL